MDGTTFAVFVGICLSTAVLFGLAPALHTTRTEVYGSLKQGDRAAGGGRGAQRWTGALSVSQLGLTIMLLTGTGLLIQSFLNMAAMSAGISTSRLMTMQFPLPGRKYPTPESRLAFLRKVDDRLAVVSALERASTASHVPLAGGLDAQLAVDGRLPAPGERPPMVTVVSVGSQYFELLGIRPVVGRTLREDDGLPGHENVVVNRRFASMHFPGQDPIGRRIRLWQDVSSRTPTGISSGWLTIVGVSPTIRQRNQRDLDPDPVVYMPRELTSQGNRATLLVRSRLDAANTAALLRNEIRLLDPDMPLFNVSTMEESLSQQRWPLVLAGTTFSAFAGIALVLSAVGLYGLTAFSVSRRTQEIGVRIALGARPSQIVWLVLRRVVMQVWMGIAVGVAGAFVVQRTLQSLLVQTSSADPRLLSAMALILAAVVVNACIWPGRRATRLDPLTALRHE